MKQFALVILFALALGNLNAQPGNSVEKEIDASEIKKLHDAVEANPNDFETHWAYIKAMKFDSPDLIKQYDEWIKKYPGIAMFPYSIGYGLTNREKPIAKAYLLKTLEIDPKFHKAYYNLWRDAQRWGDFETGDAYLLRAKEMDPKNDEYAFAYSLSFATSDPAKYKELTLEMPKNFPGSNRSAQALALFAKFSKNDKDKIAVWEQLRTQFSPETNTHSAWGMIAYFDYLLFRDPPKAVDLAKELSKLQIKEFESNVWAQQAAVASNIENVTKLIADKKPKEALALVNATKLFKHSWVVTEFEIFKVGVIEATGNIQAAYDSILILYSKKPSDQASNVLKKLGTKIGKNEAQIKQDLTKVRYAKAEPATNFTLEKYLEPGKASLSDFKGKVILLTYWFPGCGPCRAEFPHFENVVRKFKGKDFIYLGLNIAPEQDAYVVPFIKNSGYSFIPLKDAKDRMKGNMDNRGLAPVNFLIDKEGKIVFSWFRIDESNERTLELMISELLEDKVTVKKPGGIQDSVFYAEVMKFKLIEHVEDREAKYKDLLNKFPEDGEKDRPTHYRRMRTSLTVMWSDKGNISKTREYYNMVKKELRYNIGVTIGSNLIKNKLYSEGLSILDDVMPEIMASFEKGERTFSMIAFDHYAQGLFNLKKKEEALKLIRKAYENSDKKNGEVNSTYAMILNNAGMHKEAIPVMEQLVSEGKATEEIKTLFRQSFMKELGDEVAFNKRMSELSNQLQKEMKRESDDKLIDEDPYPFTLKDLNGKMVSLADMKGKVVVLDFWATWCVPCIQSMPAMQQLVNTYKNDPKVIFYFIDTGERIPDFESAVRRILKAKNFDFQVLFDVKDTKRDIYPVNTGFRVTGLPTKLVLDGNSRVRYRIVGFEGLDNTVAELTAMIEKAKIL